MTGFLSRIATSPHLVSGKCMCIANLDFYLPTLGLGKKLRVLAQVLFTLFKMLSKAKLFGSLFL